MNAPQPARQSEIAQQEAEQPRRAELSPDDYPEAGEPGLEDLPATPDNMPKKEWNPDDFPEAEQPQQ